MSYLHKWTPLVIVGTVFILSLPWLGLIALMVVLAVVAPPRAGDRLRAVHARPGDQSPLARPRWRESTGSGGPARKAVPNAHLRSAGAARQALISHTSRCCPI
jgi:hypothetical protein